MFAAKNMLLTPKQAGFTTVAFDALGTGYSTQTTTSTVSGSWSHTATAGDAVIVMVATGNSGTLAFSSYTRSATYAGTAMTSLGAINNDATFGWIEFFKATNVPGGAQTAAISITGNSVLLVGANSFSYSGSTVGTLVTNAPGSASTSMTSGTITSGTTQMVAQCFAELGGAAISSYSGTSRKTFTLVNGTSNLNIVMGDKVGAASTTITATQASSHFYASAAVAISP